MRWAAQEVMDIMSTSPTTGTGEEGFLYVLDNLVMPILEDYKPDLIINSAGQDNHYTDP